MSNKKILVASVVLVNEGKYLLIQEKRSDICGLWNIPGGRVDSGETLEQAAIRETKEETGLDVIINRPLIVMMDNDDLHLLHSFQAETVGGVLNFPDDEVLDAKWFTFTEIQRLNLRNNKYIINSLVKLTNK